MAKKKKRRLEESAIAPVKANKRKNPKKSPSTRHSIESEEANSQNGSIFVKETEKESTQRLSVILDRILTGNDKSDPPPPPFRRIKLSSGIHRARDLTGFAVTLNQNLHTAVQAISPRTLHIMDRLRYKFSAAYRHCHFWQGVAQCGRQLRHLKTLETRLKTDLQRLAELYAPTDAWIRWLGATFLAYLLRICRLHGHCAIAARKCYEQLTLEQLVVLNLVLISTVARMASGLQTSIMALIRFYDMSLSRWLRAIEPDFPVTAGDIREVIDVIKPAQSHGEVTSTVAMTSHLDFITGLLQQCDRATDRSSNKAASNWLMINRVVFSAFAQNQSKMAQNTVEQLSGADDFTFDYGEAIERQCQSDSLDIEDDKPLGFEIDRFGTMPKNGLVVISQVKTFRCVKKLLLQLHEQTDPVMVQQRETIGKIIRTVRKDATIVGKKAKRTVIMGKVREMLTEYNDFT